MNKDKGHILFETAMEAFTLKDYKRAFSSINKFKRSTATFELEHHLLEAKINAAIEKHDKANNILEHALLLTTDKAQKVTIHNMLSDNYYWIHDVNKAIDHIEQSLKLDNTLFNSPARFKLLNYYVQEKRTSNAAAIGSKLLGVEQYFIPASLLLIDVALSHDDKQTVLRHTKALMNHAHFLNEKDKQNLVIKLLHIMALDEAQLLLEKDHGAKGTLPWHGICEAIIQLKKGRLGQALTLFKNMQGYNYAFANYFYLELKDHYFMKNKQVDFFKLRSEFNDDYFNLVYGEAYISMGELTQFDHLHFTSDKEGHRHCLFEHNKLIAAWILGDQMQCQQMVKANAAFLAEPHRENYLNVPYQYFSYIKALINHNKKKKGLAATDKVEDIFVIGESHSLALSHRTFRCNEQLYRGITKFIKGVKMFHLGAEKHNSYQYYLQRHLAAIPENSNLFFMVGEIDCRVFTGISKAAEKLNASLEDVISRTVTGYLEHLKASLSERAVKSVFIQGIPAANLKKYDWLDTERQINIIKKVNEKLKSGVLAEGWLFVDVYAATCDSSGWAHGKWHIDEHHLKPSLYDEITPWVIKE